MSNVLVAALGRQSQQSNGVFAVGFVLRHGARILGTRVDMTVLSNHCFRGTKYLRVHHVVAIFSLIRKAEISRTPYPPRAVVLSVLAGFVSKENLMRLKPRLQPHLLSPQVTHDDETKVLQRQAEAVRYKNAMNVVARTGLALRSPAEAGTPSLTAFVAAAKHAKR